MMLGGKRLQTCPGLGREPDTRFSPNHAGIGTGRKSKRASATFADNVDCPALPGIPFAVEDAVFVQRVDWLNGPAGIEVHDIAHKDLDGTTVHHGAMV